MATKKVASRSYYKDSDSSGEYDPKVKFSNDKLKYLQFSPKNLKSQSPKRKSHKSDKKASPKSKKSYKDDLAKQYFSKGSSQKTVNPRKNLTSLSSNLPRKKQEEDQSLKVKMSNLQKTIVAQEKLLQDIQQKMKNERPEVVNPSDYTSKKIQNERIEDEKSILKRTSTGKSDQQNGTKKYDSLKKHDNEYIKYQEKYNDSEEESSEDEKSYIDLRKSQKNYFSANVSDGAAKRERKRDLLEEELEKKGEETVHQKRKVNEMKSVMKDITRKYEIEIDNLKHEINVLSEKNFKMKNNAISTKDQKRIEELYAKRIKDLEEAVRLKEREVAEKEGYYKSQLEDVKIKMEELQREVRKIGDYEDKVQELTQQLQLKDKEMEIIKKYYSDKLQAKTDDQIKQKKEWTNTNNDLLLEIRNLRREVDLLEYENKKLGGNSSALKQREELNYVSSRRVNHDI